ncbi:Dual specificity phosphatase domain containing protein [Aphelenchoides bicaudatus]|nr:Dual specificity phosphatase domain containing protein [Aphelenchoides bicaudatus]
MALDLSAIQKAKQKLNNVVTRVTLQDGSEIEEKRGDDGTFVESKEQDDNVVVSNRRRKAVERKKRFGYVVDLKPDLQVAKCCDGVYLSSQDVVNDFQLLKSNGITHIVNAGVGIANVFPKNFVYLNVNLLDLPDTDIRSHFDTVFDFIHNAIEKKGRVLIHCNAGVSRSSTLAIAYIMKFQNLRFQDAFDQVKAARPLIHPNDGFLKQLKLFDVELSDRI